MYDSTPDIGRRTGCMDKYNLMRTTCVITMLQILKISRLFSIDPSV